MALKTQRHRLYYKEQNPFISGSYEGNLLLVNNKSLVIHRGAEGSGSRYD